MHCVDLLDFIKMYFSTKTGWCRFQKEEVEVRNRHNLLFKFWSTFLVCSCELEDT